jgi:hypothetical protein
MVESNPSFVLNNYFDEATSSIVFTETPKDGQRFDVFYNLTEDYKTHYPIPENVRTNVETVAVWDNLTGDSIEAKIDQDYFVVAPNHIQNGREVKAQFTGFVVDLDKGITLPEIPVENSVKASGDNCSDNSITVDGKHVVVECAEADPKFLEIDYLYRTEFKNSWSFEKEIPGNSTWNVWIDGIPYFNFEIGHKTITIPPEDLTIDSVIRVRVEFQEMISNQ